MSDNPFASPRTPIANRPGLTIWEWTTRSALAFFLGLFWWHLTMAAWVGVGVFVYGEIPTVQDGPPSVVMMLVHLSILASGVGGMVGTLAAGRPGDRPRRRILACSMAGAALATTASGFVALVNWARGDRFEEALAFFVANFILAAGVGILGGRLGRKWTRNSTSSPREYLPLLGPPDRARAAPGPIEYTGVFSREAGGVRGAQRGGRAARAGDAPRLKAK